MFGRSKTALGIMFKIMLDLIYNKCRHLVTSFDLWWMQKPHLLSYANAVRMKGAPLDGCFGFIDGVLLCVQLLRLVKF